MSSVWLVLLAIGSPFLLSACGAPVAVTAASYGADGVSLVESGKSTSDHFISMVSKKDCAMWRILRGRSFCSERKDGHDPYKVDYDQANRLPSEDGVSYAPPLHAGPDAPASSWSAAAYGKPAEAEPETAQPAAPVPPDAAVTERPPAPPPAVAAKPVKSAKFAKKKSKVQVAHAKAVKKASPSLVATAP